MTKGQDDISLDDDAKALPWAQEDLPPVVLPTAADGGVGETDRTADDLTGPFLDATDCPADPQDRDQLPADAEDEAEDPVPLQLDLEELPTDEEPAVDSTIDTAETEEDVVPLLHDAEPEESAKFSACEEEANPAAVPAADIPAAQEDIFPEPVSAPPSALPVLMYTSDPPPEALFGEDDPIPDPEPFDSGPVQGGMWTIPMLCLGIAIIACCALIPQADENRRIVYQREQLRRDLEATQKQVQVNADFLRKVAHDPNLAERLAQRQMKIVREGTRVLELSDERETEMSPYHLTHVAPPDPLPPYRPRGGRLTQLCLDPQSRLYLMGGGLLLMAGGLVLGYAPRE